MIVRELRCAFIRGGGSWVVPGSPASCRCNRWSHLSEPIHEV